MQLSVTDSGCGIAPEHVPNIFNRFFTTKEVGIGYGLGLAVVHGITDTHEAKIDVTSTVGNGTTFMVFIPVMDNRRLQTFSALKNTDKTATKRHILIVEHEPALLVLYQQFLADTVFETLNIKKYLVKPVALETLFQAIEECLTGR